MVHHMQHSGTASQALIFSHVLCPSESSNDSRTRPFSLCRSPASISAMGSYVIEDRDESSSSMLETVVGRVLGRRERLSAPDAPVSTPRNSRRSRRVETVADDLPGTDSSVERTCGIETSRRRFFNSPLSTKELCRSKSGSNSSTQMDYCLATNTCLPKHRSRYKRSGGAMTPTLSYLDELTALYGKELKVANFDAFRRRLVRHA